MRRIAQDENRWRRRIFSNMKYSIACSLALPVSLGLHGQVRLKPCTVVTKPLHAVQPDYPVPYVAMTAPDIKKTLDKVFAYLDANTQPQMVNRSTGQVMTDASQFDTMHIIKPGDFRLNSYEWGVTYSGMLLAAETSGDQRYSDYVKKRFAFMAQW